MEARSFILYLISLRQGLLLKLELNWQTSSDPPVSTLHPKCWLAMPGFLCRCWGFKLGSSCLHSQPSYLLRHLSSSPSHFLGKRYMTEPHPQPPLPLKIATLGFLSLWMSFAESLPHINGVVPGVVVHSCNPSTGEAKRGESLQIWGQFGLHNKTVSTTKDVWYILLYVFLAFLRSSGAVEQIRG